MTPKSVCVSILMCIPIAICAEGWADDEGLLLHYTFKGVKNEVVLDVSGHGNHGTVFGAEKARGRKGARPRALRFDGEDDFVRVPVNISPGSLPQITITAWVRPEGTKEREVIVSNGDTVAKPYCRALGISTGTRSQKRHYNGWNEDEGLWDIQPLANDTWSFVALMYDQEIGMAWIYVNGRAYKEPGLASEGYDYFLIGGHPAYPMNFTGRIDEVRIYNRVLDVLELDTLFKAD